MGRRRGEDEERRSGTYRTVECSINEDEYREAVCLVRDPERARESSPRVRECQDRLSPCLWPLSIAGLVPTKKTIDRPGAQDSDRGARVRNRKRAQVEEVGSSRNFRIPYVLEWSMYVIVFV